MQYSLYQPARLSPRGNRYACVRGCLYQAAPPGDRVPEDQLLYARLRTQLSSDATDGVLDACDDWLVEQLARARRLPASSRV
jgi:hypothetical protein